MGWHTTLFTVKNSIIPRSENSCCRPHRTGHSHGIFSFFWLGAPCVRFQWLRLEEVPGRVPDISSAGAAVRLLTPRGSRRLLVFWMQFSCKIVCALSAHATPDWTQQKKNMHAWDWLLAALIWGFDQWNTVPWLAEILSRLAIGQAVMTTPLSRRPHSRCSQLGDKTVTRWLAALLVDHETSWLETSRLTGYSSASFCNLPGPRVLL